MHDRLGHYAQVVHSVHRLERRIDVVDGMPHRCHRARRKQRVIVGQQVPARLHEDRSLITIW
jgi:hypothetical protein